MQINQEFLNKWSSLKNEVALMQRTLNERANEVLKQMKDIYETMDYVDDVDDYSPTNINYDNVVNASLDDEEICVQTILFRHCSCCPNETYYYRFPVSYLFDNKWEQELIKQIELEKHQHLEEIKKKEIEENILREKREKLHWEQLNKKYGNKEEM